MKDFCKEAGLEGNFTNHSLRITCASRMYERQMPEQMIKEITGHRSDCIEFIKGHPMIFEKLQVKWCLGNLVIRRQNWMLN